MKARARLLGASARGREPRREEKTMDPVGEGVYQGWQGTVYFNDKEDKPNCITGAVYFGANTVVVCDGRMHEGRWCTNIVMIPYQRVTQIEMTHA